MKLLWASNELLSNFLQNFPKFVTNFLRFSYNLSQISYQLLPERQSRQARGVDLPGPQAPISISRRGWPAHSSFGRQRRWTRRPGTIAIKLFHFLAALTRPTCRRRKRQWRRWAPILSRILAWLPVMVVHRLHAWVLSWLWAWVFLLALSSVPRLAPCYAPYQAPWLALR